MKNWPLPWKRRTHQASIEELAALQRASVLRVIYERELLRDREAVRQAAREAVHRGR